MIRSLASALLLASALVLVACSAPERAAAAPNDGPIGSVVRHASDHATPGPDGTLDTEAAPRTQETREMHDATDAHGAHGTHAPALEAAAPLADASLYHLDATWGTHRGADLTLADFRGRPTVVVMLYADCETACPLLIRDALRLEEALATDHRAATQFVMVTIDPERDAPERLAAYVAANDLEAPNWHFLSGSANHTRALAALLGVQYRPAGNGMFSHSNLITVLDAEGVVAVRTEGLGQPVQPAVDAIAAMVGE